MKKQIKLFFITSIILLMVLFSGKTEIKAAFCGVDQGYQATVSINAKTCFKQWNQTYSCNNNGTWSCNGSYPCQSYDLTQGGCWYQGFYGSGPSTCFVNVMTVNSGGTNQNGCDIPADASSCTPLYYQQVVGCWVSSSTPTPTSGTNPTDTPTPTTAPICGSCSRCSNSPATLGYWAAWTETGGCTGWPTCTSPTYTCDHPECWTGTCTVPDEGCSLSHPGYWYSYIPTNWPSCTHGDASLCGGSSYPNWSGDDQLCDFSNSPPTHDDYTRTVGCGSAACSTMYYCSSSQVCTTTPIQYTDTTACAADWGGACWTTLAACTPNCVGPTNTPTNTPTTAPTSTPTQTPTPLPGTLTARAVEVTEVNNNCVSVPASTNYLIGTTVAFTPLVVPLSRTQSTFILSWANVFTNGSTVYTVQASPPESRAPGVTCVSQNGGAWIQNASANLTGGGTNDYAVAFLPQQGWFQTTTGNVYASGQLTSSIPSSATSPYLSLAGAGGTAGLVSYGTGYDFSLSSADLGESQVSPNGWLIQHTNTPVDYYERFNQKLTNATKTAITTNLDSLTKPSCATSPCFFTVDGDLQTASGSPWTIGAGEQMILLVSGNVTINANMTITSGGFFGLIVNGNITVTPAVTTLDGLFVGTNSTHAALFSSGSGAAQLTVHGSVIADTFSLQRDLAGLNSTTPAESFQLNPELLFTMPDEFKEAPYVWQEVAP